MLDFVNWKKNAPLEEIFEGWNRLEMLGGLNDEQAKKCANYFEYMAYWILKNGDLSITNDEFFSLVVFPFIKKVVIDCGGFDDVLFDCQKIYDFYKNICYNELKKKDEEIVLQMFEELAKK